MSASEFKPRERSRNNVFVFANQKGGVGKSTLAILFANYLYYQHKRSVIMLDTDTQMSAAKIHKGDIEKYPGKEELYHVYHFDKLGKREDMESLMGDIRSQRGDDFIIDTPGNLSRPGMVPVLLESDAIICPFMYDDASSMATLDFVNAINVIAQNEGKKLPPVFFVPNRIQPRWGRKEEFAMWDAFDSALGKFGTITRRVMANPEVQRVDSMAYNKRQNELVSPAFSQIVEAVSKNTITFS